MRTIYLASPAEVKPSDIWRSQGTSRWWRGDDPIGAQRLQSNAACIADYPDSALVAELYYHVEIAREDYRG